MEASPHGIDRLLDEADALFAAHGIADKLRGGGYGEVGGGGADILQRLRLGLGDLLLGLASAPLDRFRKFLARLMGIRFGLALGELDDLDGILLGLDTLLLVFSQ